LIPVTAVTGFLDSGKTMLISRAPGDPAFGRTAVIVNEVGEIGPVNWIMTCSPPVTTRSWR
jgi:G3E family GTPase